MKAKRFGGSEVDHEFKPRRPLERQICRIGASEYLIDENRCPAEGSRKIHAVTDEAASPCKLRWSNRGKSTLGRQFRKHPAVRVHEGVIANLDRTQSRFSDLIERGFELAH